MNENLGLKQKTEWRVLHNYFSFMYVSDLSLYL